MTTRVVSALFDDYEDAATAVERVEAEGIRHADIAIVSSNESERHSGRVLPGTGRSSPEGGAGAGATVGTVLGGGAGLLAGLGLLAIPGVGPVVAAGWLVAAVTGAGVGAASGGLLGALAAAGMSDAEAEAYAEGVRRGGTLVTVRADDARADRVVAVLAKSGSVDLDERALGWRSQGWESGTAGTNAAAPDATPSAVAGPTSAPPDPETSPPTKRSPDHIR